MIQGDTKAHVGLRAGQHAHDSTRECVCWKSQWVIQAQLNIQHGQCTLALSHCHMSVRGDGCDKSLMRPSKLPSAEI